MSLLPRAAGAMMRAAYRRIGLRNYTTVTPPPPSGDKRYFQYAYFIQK
jgi:hypothetical protein